jgi:hypothetical protein
MLLERKVTQSTSLTNATLKECSNNIERSYDMTKCFVAMVTLACFATAAMAYDCSAWPEGGGPLPGGGYVPPLGEGNTFQCWENWVGPIESTITPTLAQLVFTEDVYNGNPSDSLHWTRKATINRTQAWQVSGSGSAEVKAGVLARVIADGHITVSVGGQLSGSESVTYTDEFSTNIAPCKALGRRDYLDSYTATVHQDFCDTYWLRSDDYGVGLGHSSIDGTGSGCDHFVVSYVQLPGGHVVNEPPCPYCSMD